MALDQRYPCYKAQAQEGRPRCRLAPPALGTALAVPQCPLTNECVMPFAKWTFQTCETLNFEQRHPFSSACPFGMVGEGPCGAWGGPGGDGAQQTVRSVMRYCSGVLLRRSLWRLGHSRALSGLTGTDAVFGGLVASMRWRGRAAWHCAPRGMHGKDNAGASGRAGGRGPALALASPGTCTCAWRSCNPLRQPIAVVGGTECPSDTPRAHMLWAVSLDHSVRPAARDIIGTAMRRWPALLPSDTSQCPPPPPPQRLRDMPSGCGSFTGPWTVPRSSVSRAASGHCPPAHRQTATPAKGTVWTAGQRPPAQPPATGLKRTAS